MSKRMLISLFCVIGLLASACGSSADSEVEAGASEAIEAPADDPEEEVEPAVEAVEPAEPELDQDEEPVPVETAVAASADITIVGDPIPGMPEGVQISNAANDDAVGTLAPTLTGTGFDEAEVTIGADGRPKVVYFVAHWCPHCQAEVPMVQGLIDSGAVPEGVDVYAVSTAVESSQDNFPPADWLAREGFTPLTVRDNANSDAYRAFGGSGFPYTVYLNGDNEVVGRSVGSIDAAQTEALWEALAAS